MTATNSLFLSNSKPPSSTGLAHDYPCAPEWTFKFMGSNAAVFFMPSSPFISRLVDSGKLQLLPIPANYYLDDRETISQMFTHIHLYRDLLAPFGLATGYYILCQRTQDIERLLGVGLGVPWSKTAPYGDNGGLSLRKGSKALDALKTKQRKVRDGPLEDLWLSNNIHFLPGSHMLDATISKTFGVESVWDDALLGYYVEWLGFTMSKSGMKRNKWII